VPDALSRDLQERRRARRIVVRAVVDLPPRLLAAERTELAEPDVVVVRADHEKVLVRFRLAGLEPRADIEAEARRAGDVGPHAHLLVNRRLEFSRRRVEQLGKQPPGRGEGQMHARNLRGGAPDVAAHQAVPVLVLVKRVVHHDQRDRTAIRRLLHLLRERRVASAGPAATPSGRAVRQVAEDEDNPTFDIEARVVVVAEFGRVDAEPRKHRVRCQVAGAGHRERVEVRALRQRRLGVVGKRQRPTTLHDHVRGQRHSLKKTTVLAGRREGHFLKARRQVFRDLFFRGGPTGPPREFVRREKPKVRVHPLRRDRSRRRDLSRFSGLLGGLLGPSASRDKHECKDEQDGEKRLAQKHHFLLYLYVRPPFIPYQVRI